MSEIITDVDEALEVFRTVGANRKSYVTFWYVNRDGKLVRIAGSVVGWATSSAGRCVRVRTADGTIDGTIARYSASGIRDGETRHRAQHTQSTGRGPILATDAQVAYARSLCGRTCPGGGNYHQPSAAEFKAMTRHGISIWIGMALGELGDWA